MIFQKAVPVERPGDRDVQMFPTVKRPNRAEHDESPEILDMATHIGLVISACLI
jgi:hypothetical protein